MIQTTRRIFLKLFLALAAACSQPAGELPRGEGAYVTETTCYPLLWEFTGEHEKTPPGLERPAFERRGDTMHPPRVSR